MLGIVWEVFTIVEQTSKEQEQKQEKQEEQDNEQEEEEEKNESALQQSSKFFSHNESTQAPLKVYAEEDALDAL